MRGERKKKMIPVTWICPFCGFLIPDVVYSSARFNYYCPRCNQKKLSQFNLRKEWLMNDKNICCD